MIDKTKMERLIPFHMKMPQSVHSQLREASFKTKTSMARIVVEATEDHLSKLPLHSQTETKGFAKDDNVKS